MYHATYLSLRVGSRGALSEARLFCFALAIFGFAVKGSAPSSSSSSSAFAAASFFFFLSSFRCARVSSVCWGVSSSSDSSSSPSSSSDSSSLSSSSCLSRLPLHHLISTANPCYSAAEYPPFVYSNCSAILVEFEVLATQIMLRRCARAQLLISEYLKLKGD